MSQSAPLPPARRITPGCLMLIVGAVWLLVLGGWMVSRMYAQLKEIRTFTDSSPRLVTPLKVPAEQVNTLRDRINAFGVSVGKKEKALLRLTAEDLNILLAEEEPAKPMRDKVKVESIGETIKLQISVAMNGVPFSGELLYLNGFAEINPEKHAEKGVRLDTRDLTVPGRTVTEGFLKHYKEQSHLDALLLDEMRKSSNPSIMDVLKKVTTIRLENGAVVFDYAP